MENLQDPLDQDWAPFGIEKVQKQAEEIFGIIYNKTDYINIICEERIKFSDIPSLGLCEGNKWQKYIVCAYGCGKWHKSIKVANDSLPYELITDTSISSRPYRVLPLDPCCVNVTYVYYKDGKHDIQYTKVNDLDCYSIRCLKKQKKI